MNQVVVYMCFTRVGFKFDQKKASQWLKKISAHFDHYNLINEEELTVKIWYLNSVISQFQDLTIGFIKTCLD